MPRTQPDKPDNQVDGLKVEWWPIDRPKPYPANPRKLSKRAIETVARSLKDFGWRQPIVVDKKEIIVAGHTRLLAAKSLKMAHVPVHVADKLTAAQIRAYRIMDNRSAEESRWDDVALEAELREMAALELADLEATGLREQEISEILGTPANEDDVPELLGEPTTRPGDLWLLGEHRILCGDSTSAEAVARLLAGRAPVLMVTDPPYGVQLDSEWRDRAGINKRGRSEPSYMKKRTAGHSETGISGDTIADWSHAFELVPSLSVAYVWHASIFTVEVLLGLRRIGFEHQQQIIWSKPLASFTRTHYWFAHEPCWYVRKKNAPWFAKSGAHNTTVWEAASPKMIMGGSDEEKFDHPTQKPVDLMRRPILNHTHKGALVYEPFLGSGTTLAAAELTGRVCLGLELAPKYVDVVIARWQGMSGKAATLDGDGRSFETIKAERCSVKATPPASTPRTRKRVA